MFKIKDNKLLKNGIIKYEDEMGNVLNYIKKENSAVVKIRMKNVKAEIEPIELDSSCKDGVSFNIHFNPRLNKFDDIESINTCITNVQQMLPYLYDLTMTYFHFLNYVDNIGNMKKILSEENIEFQSKNMVQRISEFIELEDLARALLK